MICLTMSLLRWGVRVEEVENGGGCGRRHVGGESG